jgi:hypothetical protein
MSACDDLAGIAAAFVRRFGLPTSSVRTRDHDNNGLSVTWVASGAALLRAGLVTQSTLDSAAAGDTVKWFDEACEHWLCSLNGGTGEYRFWLTVHYRSDSDPPQMLTVKLTKEVERLFRHAVKAPKRGGPMFADLRLVKS